MTRNTPPERIEKARAVHMERSAIRALDDPRQLARAARIVRAALERNRLTLADITAPEGVPDAVA